MLTVTVNLQEMTCSACSARYAIPEDLYNRARQYGERFYCPFGHAQQYAESEIDRIRRERDRLKQEQARLEQEKAEAWATANSQLRRAEKAEGETRRIKKRAAAALCPCCNRHFADVARHIKTKHPEVVPLPAQKIAPVRT